MVSIFGEYVPPGMWQLIPPTGQVYVINHWDEVLDWFRNFLPKVAKTLREIDRKLELQSQYVTEVRTKVLNNDIATIEHCLYVKEAQGWTETITTIRVPVTELPPKIRCKVKTDGESNDITVEMEAELGMKI